MRHHTVAKSAAQNAKKWGVAAVLTGIFTIAIIVPIGVLLQYGPYALSCQYGHGVQCLIASDY